MTIAFLACVERGPLEPRSVLLAESIRTFGGRYADAAIYTFQPREGTEVAPETLELLEAYGVTHITETLNTEFPEYPIGNKVLASAWAEVNLDEDVLVFLDTDTIIVAEPDELDLADGIDAAARPVDRKRYGSTGEGDTHEGWWRWMLDRRPHAEELWVETTVDDERIRAYFNAGLIAARRSAGLFEAWRDDLIDLMRADREPPDARIQFLDQFSLATALARAGERLNVLPWTYNYPLPLRRLMPEPRGVVELGDLVHVHYHRWFQRPDFLHLLEPALDPDDPIMRWLEPRLPLSPTIDEAVNMVT